MTVWYVDLDYYNIGLTLAIGFVFMILALVIFYLLWLRSPELEVPTSFQSYRYAFDKTTGFFGKMKILIRDIQNHSFWMVHIGFDGKLISL